MEKKIRFIIAIIGIGVASFSSLDINAREKPADAGCWGQSGECGKSDTGHIIVGQYMP